MFDVPVLEDEKAGYSEQNTEEGNIDTTPEPAALPEDDNEQRDNPEQEPEREPEPETTTDDENTDLWERGVFPFSFIAKDLHGNTVTEETLGEKQLFFLHLWGTWCPPCVNEMPDLAVVVEEFGDRVGFLGLLDDFSTNPDGAKRLLESVNMPESFIDIDARLPEIRDLVALVNTGSVPTTVIVAPDGRVSEPIVGARGPGYADILNYILESEG